MYMINKRTCDFQSYTSINWSINYNASLKESNIQCDVIEDMHNFVCPKNRYEFIS